MQKYRLIVMLILATLLAACGGGSASGAAGGDSGGGTTTTADTTAPTAGTAIAFSGISDTTITVSWGAASDAATATANLQYRLVRAATSAAIDTVAEIDAAAGGVTVVDDYTSALTSRNVTGLTASTTYFFAVVVRDTAGNKAIYTPASATTSAAGTTASPVFNPAPGTFGTAQNLQMTSSTGGAIVCYTSGASPVSPVCNAGKTACTTGILYSTAVVVSATATYKAIACKSGNSDSSETSGLYTITNSCLNQPGEQCNECSHWQHNCPNLFGDHDHIYYQGRNWRNKLYCGLTYGTGVCGQLLDLYTDDFRNTDNQR